jgi:hypothetical protein
MKKIKDEIIIDYLFNENNYKKVFLKEDLNSVFDAGNKVEEKGDALKKKGMAALANIGTGVKNFAVFPSVCTIIARKLNESWGTKTELLVVLNQIYKKSMVVLTFFYKSNLKAVIMRGFKTFYTWDLALAAIYVHESFAENGMDAKKAAAGTNLLIMKQKIEEYHNKIITKRLIRNKSSQVIDTEASQTTSSSSPFKDEETEDTTTDQSAIISDLAEKIKDLVGGANKNLLDGNLVTLIDTSKLPDTQKREIKLAINKANGLFNRPIPSGERGKLLNNIGKFYGENKNKGQIFTNMATIVGSDGTNIATFGSKVSGSAGAVYIGNAALNTIKDQTQKNKMELIVLYCYLPTDLQSIFETIIKEAYKM